MKKFKYSYILFFSAYLLIVSCNSDNNSGAETDSLNGLTTNIEHKSTAHSANSNTKSEKNNLNVSILLDLSDRISPEKYPMPGMEIYQRDLGYIQSISKAFEEHLRNSRIRKTDDQMQVFFEPEPMNSEINKLASSMKLSFNKDNISKETISQIGSVYKGASLKIYQLALKDKQFVGSDIWSFFKNKVTDYCIKPRHRNILVILTDGYMFHQDNKIREGNQTTYLTPELIKTSMLNVSKYETIMAEQKFGFIPASTHLEALEVLIIGINPEKGRNFEGDVIKKYWEDWLIAMGVKDFAIKGVDLPSHLDPVIRTFITN